MSTPPSPPQPPKPQPAKSSYQEMDSVERSLPPIVPVLIAFVIVGALVFFVVRSNRPVTPATGNIAKVFAVEQTSKDRVLAGIEVHVTNASEKAIYVKDVVVKITTDKGDLTDTPASAFDIPRYEQAYPDLKQSNAPWMGDNTKILPGQSEDGLLIVGYAITKAQWDQRKSVEVTINLYDQKPLVLKQPDVPSR